MSLLWSNLSEGDALPVLQRAPDVVQLVKYAAGSSDFHPLHYDRDCPQARAIGSVLVQGRLKYAILGQLVCDWLGSDGRLVKLGCRYLAPDEPSRTMTFRGHVLRKYQEESRHLVELKLSVTRDDGRITTLGSALVELHCAPDGAAPASQSD